MNASTEFQRVERPETDVQTRAIQRVADAVHRMNEAVQRAVSEGISVELVRVTRHHNGGGAWGDQVVPAVRGSRLAEDNAA